MGSQRTEGKSSAQPSAMKTIPSNVRHGGFGHIIRWVLGVCILSFAFLGCELFDDEAETRTGCDPVCSSDSDCGSGLYCPSATHECTPLECRDCSGGCYFSWSINTSGQPVCTFDRCD